MHMRSQLRRSRSTMIYHSALKDKIVNLKINELA